MPEDILENDLLDKLNFRPSSMEDVDLSSWQIDDLGPGTLPDTAFSKFYPSQSFEPLDLTSIGLSESEFLSPEQVVGVLLRASGALTELLNTGVVQASTRPSPPPAPAPVFPLGSSLAITEAIVQAEIAGYAEVNGGAYLTSSQAPIISKNRVEIDNALSPLAVAHGVEIALRNIGVLGIGNLPPTDKNFTTITAAQYESIKNAKGVNIKADIASHGISITAISLGNGFSLKFYGQPDGTRQAAVVHDTLTLRHILVDLPEFKFGSDEVNGSIAEAYGNFATVDDASLIQLKVIAHSVRSAAGALDEFNRNHPNQYVVKSGN
jgi:hypothetical protein